MQDAKAITFQALHQGPGCFVMPNAWDAGSAILLETLGFKAVATTSAGLAFCLGVADGANAVSREETVANAGAIANATTLPVSADLEGGFGPAPEDCAKTIIAAAKAGVVGGSIEDSTGDDAGPIYDLDHAIARVTAAVEAARSLAFPFTLTARAENFLHGRHDLKDTVKRLQAFQEAGADVLFAPGLRSPDDIRSVISSIDRPLNVVMGLQSLKLSVSELAELGVKRVSVGGSLARAALAGLLKAARELHEHGTFSYAAEAVPHTELNSFLPQGLDLPPPAPPQDGMAGAPDFTIELTSGMTPVCGIDEAGRGPWAGPVVAAAVILDAMRIPPGLNDSKKLTEARREALYPAIMESAVVGVAMADVERIDRDNILAATLWAMAEAVSQLPLVPRLALVDGNRPPRLSCTVQTVVDGDARCLSIAAASIIAKVTRDRLMKSLDLEYPDYGFAAHKGYGTPEHQSALQRLGPCPLHRHSFAPIRALLSQN